MGAMNDLDLWIREESASDLECTMLKLFINWHINGQLPFELLPEKARDILVMWEERHATCHTGSDLLN